LPAESSLLSYGLVVHLLLLSTTHRCVAVAFGYRPESVYLERTFTSLTTRAFRRTSPAFQRRGRKPNVALSSRQRRLNNSNSLVANATRDILQTSFRALKSPAKFNRDATRRETF